MAQHLRKYGQTGQTIYVVMLIIACVALGIAIAFPACEYVILYGGEDLTMRRQPRDNIRTAPVAKPKDTAAPPGEAAPKPVEDKPEEAPAPVPEGG